MGNETQTEAPSFPGEASGRGVDKGFRLSPEENDRLMNGLIPLAKELGCIPEVSLQKYMIFCLNCGALRLSEVYKHQFGE